MKLCRLVLIPASVCLIGVDASAEVGNAEEGRAVFTTRCSMCHEVEAEKTKVGPSLFGVWGRKAGSIEGFAYSEAMANAELVWDEANLTGYLLNPKEFVPQNKMTFFGVKRPGELEDLLEFLKTLSP